MDIELVVKKTISENLKNVSINSIKLESTLNELGADSLDSVEILLTLENKFKINITESDFEEIKTIGSFIELIKVKLTSNTSL